MINHAYWWTLFNLLPHKTSLLISNFAIHKPVRNALTAWYGHKLFSLKWNLEQNGKFQCLRPKTIEHAYWQKLFNSLRHPHLNFLYDNNWDILNIIRVSDGPSPWVHFQNNSVINTCSFHPFFISHDDYSTIITWEFNTLNINPVDSVKYCFPYWYISA